MMAGQLNPFQLQAGPTLFSNQGLAPAKRLTDSIANVRGTAFLANIYAAYQLSGSLSPATSANLIMITSNIGNIGMCAFADGIPNNMVANISAASTDTTVQPSSVYGNAPGLTGMIYCTANVYLGKDLFGTVSDNSKFVQAYDIASGYIESTNIFVNSAANANDYLGNTYQGPDDLMTGQLTSVNLATEAMADDLYNLGEAINLAAIDSFGTPLALIQQIVSQANGVVTPIMIALTLQGVNENIVLDLTNPDLVVTDTIQRDMYLALKRIQGDDLAQILQILGVTTANLSSLADLLDPTKIFPNSFLTLLTPTINCNRPIYKSTTSDLSIPSNDQDYQAQLADEAANRRREPTLPCEGAALASAGTGPTGAVNSSLLTTLPPNAGIGYDRLSKIIPPDQALADIALAESLKQVTNLANMDLRQLADAFAGVESARGLEAVREDLAETPIDSYAENWYQSNLATGTGPNGSILLSDVLGTAIGYNEYAELAQVANLLANLQSSGAMANLTNIYANLYASAAAVDDAGVDANVILAQNEISNLWSALSGDDQVTLYTAYQRIGDQLVLEFDQQGANYADIQFANLQANQRSAVSSFIVGLDAYAQDIEEGGSAQFLELIADIGNANAQIALGAQSMVAALREGRTQAVLNSNGVGTFSTVPEESRTPQPLANLIPSTYSYNQAQAIIKPLDQ